MYNTDQKTLVFEMAEDGFLAFDFQYAVLNAARFQNWWEKKELYIFTDKQQKGITFPEYVPVGSIEFTENFFGKKFKPINVPEILSDRYYSGRTIERIINPKYEKGYFYKDMSCLKGNSGREFSEQEIFNGHLIGLYQVSEIVDIESEWRVFVHNGNKQAIQYYSGDRYLFPSIVKIEQIIHHLNNTDISTTNDYALDVYVNNKGTYCMEVHHIFSCGTYGYLGNNFIVMYLRGLMDTLQYIE